MNADTEQWRLDRMTSRILGCGYRVSNALGCGFLEKVYENALAIELRAAGMHCEQQRPFQVRYRQEVVGEYIPDLLVNDSVIVEVKSVDSLSRIHEAQCMNYLRATSLHVALLLNFHSPRLEKKRIVWGF
jgi:GxxExxY protein